MKGRLRSRDNSCKTMGVLNTRVISLAIKYQLKSLGSVEAGLNSVLMLEMCQIDRFIESDSTTDNLAASSI